MFSMSTCGPCIAIKPKILEIPNINIAIVTIDEFDDPQDNYKSFAKTFPTFHYFKNGYLDRLPTVGANLREIYATVEIWNKSSCR